MNRVARQWLQITFVLVLVYLLVRNAKGASAVVRSSSSAYVNSVKALQGR